LKLEKGITYVGGKIEDQIRAGGINIDYVDTREEGKHRLGSEEKDFAKFKI
jgi:hypothetical protein